MNMQVLISLILALSFLNACGRPLTESERIFAQDIHGSSIDLNRVSVAPSILVGMIKFRRPVRPRITCKERIFPPTEAEFIEGSPAAAVYFNSILFRMDWYRENYLPNYPDSYSLPVAMLLAHELTHVWQWQNRDLTGYHPLKALSEHAILDDPYLFDNSINKQFLDYGFEQQGAIVEEYICCRSIAPAGSRTQRLHAMLSKVFPVSMIPDQSQRDISLPLDKAELTGVCD
ncbi:MAG: hypothetical protein OXC62_16010 [Aestuariivita sp.]|nr:hypothetical protein [Aestuariivita sp.]